MRRLLMITFLALSCKGGKLLVSSVLLEGGDGGLFPASRSRHRQAGPRSQATPNEFASVFGSSNRVRDGDHETLPTKPIVLPSFKDVIWKFNRKLIKEKNSHYLGKPSQKDTKYLNEEKRKVDDKINAFFSKFSGEDLQKNSNDIGNNFEAVNTQSHDSWNGDHKKGVFEGLLNWSEQDAKGNLEQNKNYLQGNLKGSIDKFSPNDDHFASKIFSNFVNNFQNNLNSNSRKNISEWNKEESDKRVETPITQHQPVTNSPIFYIKLPASPYELHPSLGYISKPTTYDFEKFLHPQITFLANGQPTIVYQPPTVRPITIKSTTVKSTLPFSKTPSSTEKTTNTTTSRTSTRATTTSSPSPTATTQPPSLNIASSNEFLPPLPEPSFTNKLSFKPSQTGTEKPLRNYTNSPVTWLRGPFKFNGMPKDFFFFKSKPHVRQRFDYLHKMYPKPGVYIR